MINRPAFRYHGSKWRIAPWIIEQFPQHECYVEPFGGNASVLLRKTRSWLEVYNDKAGDVVNFFRVLREQPDDLVRAINLTPWSKEEWEQALAFQDEPDPLERARLFYACAYMTLAGASITSWSSGWRRQKVITKQNGKKKMTPACISFMNTSHLYEVANRIRGVQIECDDALAVIARYDSPETLFYLDPPYPASTRGRWKNNAYLHEMTDEQHRELASLAHGVQGMVIISGYRCELYEDLYCDWKQVARATRTNSAGSAVECLWLSP